MLLDQLTHYYINLCNPRGVVDEDKIRMGIIGMGKG
jgi:hypothetical protein